MKCSILLALCLSVATAFAGTDIDEFSAKDSGTPDDFISAEFGGKLKTIPADEVESLQDGRIVMRQKFEDPFGDAETSYQLYQGSAGDLSSMTAMTADNVDYSKLVSAKLYKNSSADENEDVEKVYFDGKSVFAEGLTSAVVYVDGSPVTLKGEGATETAEASSDEYCDEYDTDCEDEDEDVYQYKTTAPVDNSAADSRDYAASDAASDVGDRFGIADEVRFWSAVGLTALAATSIVVGILQHSQANKAQDAYDELAGIDDGITAACQNEINPNACREIMIQKGEYKTATGVWTVADLQRRMNKNKKTHDSYASARNVWFGIAGASIAGAVVLYVW